MNNMRRLFLAAVALALVACASTPDTQSAESREATYRTGSNIPVRDGGIGPAVKSGEVPTVKVPPQPKSGRRGS